MIQQLACRHHQGTAIRPWLADLQSQKSSSGPFLAAAPSLGRLREARKNHSAYCVVIPPAVIYSGILTRWLSRHQSLDSSLISWPPESVQEKGGWMDNDLSTPVQIDFWCLFDSWERSAAGPWAASGGCRPATGGLNTYISLLPPDRPCTPRTKPGHAFIVTNDRLWQ